MTTKIKKKGNQKKYLSYKFAHSQIKRAIENEFPIEAIGIEESIISDRIFSFLSGIGSIKKGNQKWPNFNKLIDKLGEEIRNGNAELDFKNIDLLHDWRKKRNTVIHGIAKSSPGKETNLEEFKSISMEAAKEGKLLVGRIQKWHKQELRKFSRTAE